MDETTQALARFGLDEKAMSQALGTLLGHAIDDGDLYLEHIESESIALEEGIVKKASRSVSQGAGVRAVTGERTGYAHSDEFDARELIEAAKTARARGCAHIARAHPSDRSQKFDHLQSFY